MDMAAQSRRENYRHFGNDLYINYIELYHRNRVVRLKI